MNYGDYIGSEGASHPEVASWAVRNASQQTPSPVYGYLRTPVGGISHQRIYLFNTLEEGHGWFMGLVHDPSQPYDYVAVFVATDLSRPVSGLESFGHTPVSGGAYVGNMLPFLLGLPLGALGGYFYRGWHDEHPGKWIPGIAGDYAGGYDGGYAGGYDGGYAGGYDGGYNVGCSQPAGDYSSHVGGPWLDVVGPQVGGPWLDVVGPQVGGPWLDVVGPQVGGPWLDVVGPQVGGPWLDVVGPQVGGPWLDVVGADLGARERRLAWQQTRALIESAKREASNAQASTPAAAWVWSLDPTGLPPGTGADLTTSQLTPFSSLEQAQAYMFERIHTPHVALALFDPTAARHWPNPVRWTKSTDPTYEPLIAQRAALFSPERVSGDSQQTVIGTALGDVRNRAQTLANKRAGNVVGVIHTTRDNLWHALAFRNVDDADEWLETQDQGAFTYAAYFDKGDATWPNAVIEKIGGLRAPKTSGGRVGAALDDTRAARVGAALDDTRAYGKSLAGAKPGGAAGVVRSEDGTWFTYAFPNLDAAIDWLSGMTAYRRSFTYAAAYEKGSDGTAYIQQEEFGVQPVPPLRRALAATSGEQAWRAA